MAISAAKLLSLQAFLTKEVAYFCNMSIVRDFSANLRAVLRGASSLQMVYVEEDNYGTAWGRLQGRGGALTFLTQKANVGYYCTIPGRNNRWGAYEHLQGYSLYTPKSPMSVPGDAMLEIDFKAIRRTIAYNAPTMYRDSVRLGTSTYFRQYVLPVCRAAMDTIKADIDGFLLAKGLPACQHGVPAADPQDIKADGIMCLRQDSPCLSWKYDATIDAMVMSCELNVGVGLLVNPFVVPRSAAASGQPAWKGKVVV